jgi:hypothetical protein
VAASNPTSGSPARSKVSTRDGLPACCDNRAAFDNYAQKFTADGDTRIAQQASGRKVVKQNFVVDDEILADFREQLKTDKIKIDEEGFQKISTSSAR